MNCLTCFWYQFCGTGWYDDGVSRCMNSKSAYQGRITDRNCSCGYWESRGKR